MDEYTWLTRYREILRRTDKYVIDEQPPGNVSEWLLHTDSLTQKLQQICNALTVEVTRQGWQAVGFEQHFANVLPNLTACSSCWLREVVLKADGVPVIFAQTVLPEETVNTVAQEVLNWGERPIGLWLFPQQPRRVTLEWQQDQASGLYARRSQLALKGYPLEVRELFLPQFPFETTERKA